MKLHHLRISNFQSFGPTETEILFHDLTFVIGPNGAGKTAVLQALSRLFGFDPNSRRVHRSDFHIPLTETPENEPSQRSLYIEAEFTFPELSEDKGDFNTIPPNFAHMRLDTAKGVPRVRFRLDATIDAAGDIVDDLSYVLDVDADGQPMNKHTVPRGDRNYIHVHYLPARRDPSDHISYTAHSMLGRALRAADWQADRQDIAKSTKEISDRLHSNGAVKSLGAQLSAQWTTLHTGSFFTDPEVTFIESEMESLLRYVSVSFSPGHGEQVVNFARLSDGQKSLLYLALVLTMQRTGQAILSGTEKAFDVDKFKPAIFTLFAVEEPENSLSPHYLGRVVEALREFGRQNDAQAVIATHSPSMLRRVDPEDIRYLRLDSSRQTLVTSIVMPKNSDESHKYVREAVQAFPELYFSRLVVLGEGDTEEIILPRLMSVRGSPVDRSSISIVPLGGRHINHFWRLLTTLQIPFLTLLDLDSGRHQGGWGRIRYVATQLRKFAGDQCGITEKHIASLPAWNSERTASSEKLMQKWITSLETKDVFFSAPLDLDFAMLTQFRDAYGVDVDDLVAPDVAQIKAVLGGSYNDAEQYDDEEQKLFITYHKKFKLGSKPATHLSASSNLDNAKFMSDAPAFLSRIANAASAKLKDVPE